MICLGCEEIGKTCLSCLEKQAYKPRKARKMKQDASGATFKKVRSHGLGRTAEIGHNAWIKED